MLYFAYGSNLHPLRLGERLLSPEFISIATLPYHRLVFHKLGVDRSGKATLLATGSDNDMVYGAVYEMEDSHREQLDEIEGEGYLSREIVVTGGDRELSCYTYIAHPEWLDKTLKPYHWYKDLVLLGAKYLELPEDYIASINSLESVNDPDTHRTRENRQLIDRLRDYPG
ncbi:MAG: gamma-glutamylcyclotransferase family protein, partial [Gammaproteobacteria bacterium]|nr:gamma-glutamylcyclotransferase family protein [Gammaproteobacteria bacterium]